jgi:hypothetical protein
VKVVNGAWTSSLKSAQLADGPSNKARTSGVSLSNPASLLRPDFLWLFV